MQRLKSARHAQDFLSRTAEFTTTSSSAVTALMPPSTSTCDRAFGIERDVVELAAQA